MIMRSHFSFLWHRFSSPAWLDFVDQGLGIKHREGRFRAAWAHHLARSRAFLEEALDEGGDEVVVLGAGRLFDVPVERLVDRFERVVLVDIDPGALAWCRRRIRRWGRRIAVEQHDVTGVFSSWTRLLEVARQGGNTEVEATLRSLTPSSVSWSSEAVVSLNLLSQVGVMWRDRVRRIVGADAAMVLGVSEATAQSITRLEEAHVRGLAAAERAVLIADRSFWQVCEGGRGWEREDALYGPWPEQLPEREVWLSGSWLWDVVPIGGEIEGEGIVHEVWARAFQEVRQGSDQSPPYPR